MAINQIRGSVFVEPTNVMALGLPFISPVYSKIGGIPYGIDMRSREPACFDPWGFKNAGIINSAFGLIIADKGAGKSSLMKIVSSTLLLLAAGFDTMRVSINDYKPEGEGSEYGLLTKQFHSTEFSLANMAVNPLEAKLYRSSDKGVYELGLVHVVEMIVEFIHGGQLMGDKATALRVAMSDMVENYRPEMWSLHLFEKVSRSITVDQISRYFDVLDSKLRQQMLERSTRLDNNELKQDHNERIKHISSQSTNYDVSAIQSAGMYNSSLLGRVLYGKYGHMFGNQYSMYDTLTQRVVTQDWRGVDPEAERLMRTILTTIKTSAIESNNLELLPHIELDDEKHKAMDNLIYARSHSYFSEIARGIHTCNLSATHRLDSIRKGGVGSELYSLGETTINNLGFVFIGRQPNKKELLNELRERYALSETDTNLIPNMPKRTFLFKAGETEPARLVQVVAPPPVLPLLRTDSSTDRMVDRAGILDPERIKRFSEATGIAMAERE